MEHPCTNLSSFFTALTDVYIPTKDKDVKFQTTGVVSWPSIQVDHHFVCNVAVQCIFNNKK